MAQITQFISKPITADVVGPKDVRPDYSTANLYKGLAGAAEGVSNVIARVNEYNERKQRIDDNLFQNEAQNFAERAAQEANDAALTNPEAAKDGSDLVSHFDEQFELQKEFYLDGLSDDRRSIAEITFENVRNSKSEKLFAQQREQHGKFVVESTDENKRGVGLAVYKNPDEFMNGSLRIDKMYQTLVDEGMLNQFQADELKRKGIEETAIQAIQGEVERREFKKAKDRVINGDVSAVFDMEKRTKMLELIEREQMQAIENDLKVQKLRNEKKEIEKKEQQEKAFSNFIGAMNSSTSPADSENVWKRSQQALAQQMITVEQHRYINSLMNDTKGRYNERLEFAYHDKIMKTTTGFDVVQNDIVKSVNDGGMDAKTGNTLLGMLKTRKEAIDRDPSIGVRMSLANDFLDASFGKDTFFEPMDQPRKLAKVQASEYMHSLIGQGEDALQAAKLATLKFGKPITALPLVPGIDFKIQSDPGGLLAAKKQLKFQYDSGRFSKEEYAKRIKLLEVRERAISTQTQLDEVIRPPAPAEGE